VSPVPRQQLIELAQRMHGDARDLTSKPSLLIHVVQPSGLTERVWDGIPRYRSGAKWRVTSPQAFSFGGSCIARCIPDPAFALQLRYRKRPKPRAGEDRQRSAEASWNDP
jgi:hypothetical protein